MTTPQKISGDDNSQAGRDINNVNTVNHYYPEMPRAIHLYPSDIKELIEGLFSCVEGYGEGEGYNPDDLTYIDKEEKNKLNSLSDDYFEFIVNEQLAYFHTIDLFLKDPKNKELLRVYNKTASTVRWRIAILKSKFETFQDIISTICNELIEANKHCFGGKEPLCIILINYMYWACDIGKRVDKHVKST